MSRRKIVFDWGKIVFGLILFALGVHLTIRADLGLMPWDCLAMGISYHTPMNYGISMTVMSALILIIDVLMKERIGYGTVIDTLITGNLVQLFNTVDRFPKTKSVFSGLLIILFGLTLMAVGQFFYMSAAQCCGPKDALLVALGKRMKKVPIGAVQVVIWGTVLLVGWLLGGPVGIGTVVSTFGCGIVMQLIFSLIKFEPRKIKHQSFLETTKVLMKK